MKSILLASVAVFAASAGLNVAVAEEAKGFSAISSGTYVNDDTHTYVTFSYSHMGLSNPVLTFTDVDATVILDASDATKSTLNVDIDPVSISSGVDEFNSHLESEDFFDVKKFTDISFKSTKLTMSSDTTGTVTGDLTIKGITKPVTLDVTLNGAMVHPMKNIDAFGIEATGSVKRSDFGLGAYVPVVSDEVDLAITVEFLKAE